GREAAYAQAALEGVAEELRETGIGERNHTLNGVAYRLGGMVARDWIARDEGEAELEAAAKHFGLSEGDGGIRGVRATIKSELEAGLKEPHDDLQDQQQAKPKALHVSEHPWPVLQPEALYGLVGEVVKVIAPHTEADPVALLMQFLAYFGNTLD